LVTSLADASCKTKAEAQKKLVDELKVQWKLLWAERFDDKVRAEGISVNDYEILLVERGTVIHATRDCKALNFKEILEKQLVENPERYIAPDVNVGGWTKFIKTEITPHGPQRSKRANYFAEKTPSKGDTQQAKKGGRGWLHKS
jgi:hypothetical protein